jgi:hypothetical protein
MPHAADPEDGIEDREPERDAKIDAEKIHAEQSVRTCCSRSFAEVTDRARAHEPEEGLAEPV